MAGCEGCGGACGGCGGCSRALELTREEMDFLRKLAQIPFLPVARKQDGEEPIYLEEGESLREHYARVLLHLERKGLVSLDYDIPMAGRYSPAYDGYPVRGSIALTRRGQETVDALEYNGFEEETDAS